jgi:hypothetical protein
MKTAAAILADSLYMKGVGVFLGTAMLTVASAFGQGQFVFNNRVLPDINARFVNVTDALGTSTIGTDYSVLLFASTTALDPASTTFRGPAGSAAAGYVVPTTETVPGIAPGANANITLRVVGPNLQGGQQDFGPYTVSLGGGAITPPNLPLGTTLLTVCVSCPEPAPLWLFGVAAVFLGSQIRRHGQRS